MDKLLEIFQNLGAVQVVLLVGGVALLWPQLQELLGKAKDSIKTEDSEIEVANNNLTELVWYKYSHRRAERWTALSVTPFPNRTKTQGATLG